jgi:hypothetical protein
VRNGQRRFAVGVADDDVGDVEAGLKTAPVRRQLADGELRVQLFGNRGFDARPERIDARQQYVTQAEKETRCDEVQNECQRQDHVKGPTQHDVVASAHRPDLPSFVRVGGFVSLGHAAAGGRMVVLRINDEM